jgi:uncharacterized SAM-binding protein YcdF (DUF218 family)
MLYLTKLLTELAYPLSLAMVLAVVAIFLLFFHYRRLGIAVMAAGMGWLYLWSTPVFSDWVRGTLENRYEYLAADELPQADAIVVMGGAFDPWPRDMPYPNMQQAADRYWHGARLYHAGRAPVVIPSGGLLPWREEGLRGDAVAGAVLLTDLGVPNEALIVETEALTTRDNAVRVAAIMEEHGMERVIVVTSALHMRRSVGSFRAVGIEPIPAATDFEVVARTDTVGRWFPRAKSLFDSGRAIKEYLGYFVYRIRGWVA